MNTHDQTPTKPSKAATAAANALLAILEPEFGAWSFKDQAVANVIDKALTEERAELAAAQKLLKEREAELANTKAALAKRTDQANDYGIRLRVELTTAQQDQARYEYVRRLNPRQYAELWTKPRFDQAIDAAMKAEGGKVNI